MSRGTDMFEKAIACAGGMDAVLSISRKKSHSCDKSGKLWTRGPNWGAIEKALKSLGR